MSKIKICGTELEINFLDADDMQKYIEANDNAIKRINNKDEYEEKSIPDQMRTQCAIINEFFDNTFGAGTSEKLFQGKNDIGVHLEAFGVVSEAYQSADSRLNEISVKYTPNRVQRRFEQRQNNEAEQRQFHGSSSGWNGKRKNGGRR